MNYIVDMVIKILMTINRMHTIKYSLFNESLELRRIIARKMTTK